MAELNEKRKGLRKPKAKISSHRPSRQPFGPPNGPGPPGKERILRGCRTARWPHRRHRDRSAGSRREGCRGPDHCLAGCGRVPGRRPRRRRPRRCRADRRAEAQRPAVVVVLRLAMLSTIRLLVGSITAAGSPGADTSHSVITLAWSGVTPGAEESRSARLSARTCRCRPGRSTDTPGEMRPREGRALPSARPGR